MKKKLAAALFALLAHKHTAAAVVTAALAGASAGSSGGDPIPWAIGAFGAVVVYAHQPPSSRLSALANTGISILIGGLIAPVAALAVAEYISVKLASEYALAFVLSAAWPWALPVLIRKIERKIDAA